MSDYKLVSCEFHDQLEAWATLHQPCHIVYHRDDNETVEVDSQITDIYAADHADFLKLKDGTEIRLDKIVSVNDKQVSFANR